MADISPNVYQPAYTANGIQTAFPFSFSIVGAGDIEVQEDGVAISSALYSVTFGDTSGTVTYATAPTAGKQILIISKPNYTQASTFANQGAYNLSTVNVINRRSAVRELVNHDLATRALKVPLGEGGLTLPEAAGRAGNLLAFDDDGLPIAVAAYSGDPVAAVTAEAILRIAADATETARAMAAEGALGTRMTTAESDIDALQAATASGGTLYYPTWAAARDAFLAYNGATAYAAGETIVNQGIAWVNILASTGVAPPTLPTTSNASWQVFRNPLIGQPVYVPITDAGTHTDPTDGTTKNNTGVFSWAVGTSGTGFKYLFATDAALAAPYAAAAAVSAAAAAASAASLSGIVPQLSEDTLVGARDAAVLPAAQAATVSGKVFTLSTSGANIPIILTGDQIGDTTTTVNAVLQIVSGSAGTAFSIAVGRWYNSAVGGTQVGADVALTKTATAISYTGTQPSGARRIEFVLVPPATTTARFLAYQFGTPARPTTDAWYLALMGAGVGANDPEPLPFVAVDSTWNPLTGRVTVPATAGGLFQILVPSGVGDGDVLWVLFDSPLEPTAWLQGVTANFGASGGGSGNNYVSQVLHLGGNRFAAALYVQSAADGDFYGPRWTWNNTGAATYFENIALYVGPKPPFMERAPATIMRDVRDEIEAERIMPLVTLADDSCGISATQFEPSPGLDMAKFFGSGVKFQNMSTPGNTLTQSASTVGLLPIVVSVSGGVIPVSTSPVQITAWNYDPITSGSAGNPDYDPYAYLCGVLGRLTAGSYTGNSPATLYFTPVTAPEWPIKVPAGSKLILRASRKRKGGLTIFPLSSVNGVGGGFASDVAFADAVFAANDPNTIAGFVGLTPTPYGTGAATLTALAGKSYASRLYNPNIMSAATVAEAMSLFGWNWATGENAAWLAGNIGIPGSMRAGDGFHPYTDVSAYVLAKNHFTSAIVTDYLEDWG